MHRLDKGWLERSSELKPPRPPGVGTWGRILTRMLGMLVSRVRIAATAVDVVLEHEPTSLAQFGIPGEVLHTPGHTPGSVSILLETGEAFVGDLAMNMFPLRLGPGMPVFAHDLDQVRESWTILLDKGAAVIYPGHGKPFPADVMRRALA
jgi:hydroxyacylglutathione hydrolase